MSILVKKIASAVVSLAQQSVDELNNVLCIDEANLAEFELNILLVYEGIAKQVLYSIEGVDGIMNSIRLEVAIDAITNTREWKDSGDIRIAVEEYIAKVIQENDVSQGNEFLYIALGAADFLIKKYLSSTLTQLNDRSVTDTLLKHFTCLIKELSTVYRRNV